MLAGALGLVVPWGQAAATAGAQAAQAAATAGLMATVVTGSVALITGIFLGGFVRSH